VKNTINSLNVGDTIRVTQKIPWDRKSRVRLYEAEVEQLTQSAIYARCNGRMECITIADLASSDVQITKVVGIDNPPQYIPEKRECGLNLFL
jgi:ribosomal protein L19